MRISDWSSDVCSSDLSSSGNGKSGREALTREDPGNSAINLADLSFHVAGLKRIKGGILAGDAGDMNIIADPPCLAVAKRLFDIGPRVDDAVRAHRTGLALGRASGRESVCQYVSISVVAGSVKQKN